MTADNRPGAPRSTSDSARGADGLSVDEDPDLPRYLLIFYRFEPVANPTENRPLLHIDAHDMAKIRIAMATAGMTFPDLLPPPFPHPADYRITERPYFTARRYRSKDLSPDERRRLAAFGAALVEAASWHGKSDVPGIPEHKLVLNASMRDGDYAWLIRDVECRAAVRMWRTRAAAQGAHTRGAEALLRTISPELAVDVWASWLDHLSGAVSHGGLYVAPGLNAWAIQRNLGGKE